MSDDTITAMQFTQHQVNLGRKYGTSQGYKLNEIPSYLNIFQKLGSRGLNILDDEGDE